MTLENSNFCCRRVAIIIDKFTRDVISVCVVVAAGLFVTPALAQVDEGKTGAWYMYLWNVSDEGSNTGIQCDIQHRERLITAIFRWSPPFQHPPP